MPSFLEMLLERVRVCTWFHEGAPPRASSASSTGCQLTDGPAARRLLNLTLEATGRVFARVALEYPSLGLIKYQTNGGPPVVFR